MKKIFQILMIAAAFSIVACEEKTPETPEDPKAELNQNLTFTLEVTTVEAESAKIKVEHNGTSTDTWYGFVTKDVTKEDGTLIAAEVQSLLATGKISGLKKQTSTTVTVRGLEPQTEYKYIVCGLTEDGEAYGVYQSTKFKTAKGEVEFTENSAWTVEYKGEGQIEGTTYEHTVTVTSTDNNTYFITAVPVEYYTTKGIKAIAEEELAYLKEYIAGFNQANSTNYKLSDILFDASGIDALAFEAGEWYALAIGVDAAGECSGLYAKSAVITIEEEELTEAYAAWLGDWVFSGSNGISWDVKFEKGKANKTYKMSGWEGPDSEGLYVTVDWYEEDEVWAIYSQSLGTYSFGESGNGEIWFTGFDGQYIYPVADIPVCIGGFTEEGERVTIGYSDEDEEGNLIEMVTMQFIADIAGSYYIITETEEWPTFPMLITPANTVETRSTEMSSKNSQFANKLVKSYRTFGLMK